MATRQNQNSLVPERKTQLVQAFLKLKNEVPSQRGLASRYDDFVQLHLDSMAVMTNSLPGWAHSGPAFLPWHRYYLFALERELQMAVGEDTLGLPYWDWTVDNQPTNDLWNDDFFGPNGRADDGRVMGGPFGFPDDPEQRRWTITVQDPDDPIKPPFLVRQLASFPGVATLPTGPQVVTALGETPYYVAAWKSFAPDFVSPERVAVQPSFCNRLEGWYGAGSIHNRVHLWVGGMIGDEILGTMLLGSSPNDPIFWLHHANVDRLWAKWQQTHVTEPYAPSGLGGDLGPSGHNLNDPMQPWAGSVTPASVLDHSNLGYRYDTDPSEVVPVIPAPPVQPAHVPDPTPDLEFAARHHHGHRRTMFQLNSEDLDALDPKVAEAHLKALGVQQHGQN